MYHWYIVYQLFLNLVFDTVKSILWKLTDSCQPLKKSFKQTNKVFFHILIKFLNLQTILTTNLHYCLKLFFNRSLADNLNKSWSLPNSSRLNRFEIINHKLSSLTLNICHLFLLVDIEDLYLEVYMLRKCLNVKKYIVFFISKLQTL